MAEPVAVGALVCADTAGLVDGRLLCGVGDMDEPAVFATIEIMDYRRCSGSSVGDFGGATRGGSRDYGVGFARWNGGVFKFTR